ncbi:hypothetical protein Tco_1351017 [Tanacetum coccineum]
MVNSRQAVGPIVDSLKSFITEAIAAPLASTMADATKTMEGQVNKSIAAMNSFVNGVYNQVPQVSSVNQSFNKNKPVYNNAPQRKQLTQKALDDKRAKNQCFYYDQRYVPGHKCSGRLFSLEIVEDSRQGRL